MYLELQISGTLNISEVSHTSVEGYSCSFSASVGLYYLVWACINSDVSRFTFSGADISVDSSYAYERIDRILIIKATANTVTIYGSAWNDGWWYRPGNLLIWKLT